MFTDLKTQLASVEANLRATFDDVTTRIGDLEAEIQTIDAPFQGAFERIRALAGATAGGVDARIAALRVSVEQLVS